MQLLWLQFRFGCLFLKDETVPISRQVVEGIWCRFTKHCSNLLVPYLILEQLFILLEEVDEFIELIMDIYLIYNLCLDTKLSLSLVHVSPFDVNQREIIWWVKQDT